MSKLLKGVNDLATTHPNIAEQWNHVKNGDLKPTDVTAGSHKKIWWRCRNGHEWETKVSNRVSGTDCPYCCGRLPVCGSNDLATTNPELAAQWHPVFNGNLTPKDVSAGSAKRAWWLCEYGHEWDAVISSRNRGAGCPYCSGRRSVSKQDDLAVVKINAERR